MVGFVSHAHNLVIGVQNEYSGIFVHDRRTGKTEMVSIGIRGQSPNDYSASPAISADGRYVAFQSRASNLVEDDTNGSGDVFVFDRKMASMVRVSVSGDGRQSNGLVLRVAISSDGSTVAFGGGADTLVTNKSTRLAEAFVVGWTPGRGSLLFLVGGSGGGF